MTKYVVTFNSSSLFASVYGEGSFNSDAYNGTPTTNTGTTPETTVPGTPNTGFFQSAFSGANELSLIPILLGAAILIGAATVGVRKLVQKRK